MTPKPLAKSFQAQLERMPSRLNWIIVRLPFDVSQQWGTRGQFRVKGEINGFPFRTSLFASGKGYHYLLINRRMQSGGKAPPGSLANIRLEPDTAERIVTVPAELQRAFAGARPLQRWFERLNYSTRKSIAEWITDVKSSEARQRRAEQIAERLLATMEAERELPPMLQVAFARRPGALEAWEHMSAAQRRAQLLAIFYYRDPESRARRVSKMIDEALAKRKP